MLGGAAIGGIEANSAGYYNPAAMGHVKDPTLSINVDAYRLRISKEENILGDDLNLQNTRFVTIPNIIAGIVPLDSTSKFTFGYAIIAPRVYNNQMDLLQNETREIDSQNPGLENYIATYNRKHQANKFSAGLAVGYELSENWSLGLSHFFNFQNVNYAEDINVATLSEQNNQDRRYESHIDINYWHVTGTFKLGLQYASEQIKLGLTWQLPTYNIVGGADVFRELSVSNLDIIPNQPNFTIIDSRNNLTVRYKQNGSLGWGINWEVSDKVTFYFSQELFFGVAAYDLYEVDGAVKRYPSSVSDDDIKSVIGDDRFLSYKKDTRLLLNSGLGVKWCVGDRLDLFFGARTDFDANERGRYKMKSIKFNSGQKNMVHFSLGGSFNNYNQKTYDIGIEFGTALPGTRRGIANFSNPSLETQLIGNTRKRAKYKQYIIKLLLGISLDFNKKK